MNQPVLNSGAATESRHLLDALIRHAIERPNVQAITDRRATSWTWQQLASAVLRQANENGSIPSIAHEVRNEIADVVMALGCLASGTMEIAIDSRLPTVVRSRMLEVAGVELTDKDSSSIREPAITSDAIDLLRERSDQIDIDQPAIVLWTSGTTSSPRGVMLSARALFVNAAAKLKAVPETHLSNRLTVLPISHAYARTCDMGTWLLSGCHLTIDMGASALDRINLDRLPTHLNCVPSVANQIESRLERSDPKLSDLRILGCGGAAMSAEQFNRFRGRGIEVIQGYGCTETAPVICSASPGQSSAGCVGPLVDGWETKIRAGRLFVRGECVMLGYLNDAVATRDRIDQDGWLDTGDLVERNADETFRVLGRADDVIVLDNGYKIHPHSVESKLAQTVGVEHAIVMQIDRKVIVAIQGEIGDDAMARIADSMPPGTPFEVVTLVPPLSRDRNELTAKSTPRREAVRKRLLGQ